MKNNFSIPFLVDMIGQGYELDSVSYLKKSFNLYRQAVVPYTVHALLTIIALSVSKALPVVGPILGMIVSSLAFAGFYDAGIRQLKGAEIEFSDFYRVLKDPVPLAVCGFLTGVMTTIGFVCLIIPGLYLMVAYLFALPLIIDKKVDFWTAMEVSRRAITKRWFSYGFLFLILMVLNALGAIAFGVGLLITIPVSMLSIAVCYGEVAGLEP